MGTIKTRNKSLLKAISDQGFKPGPKLARMIGISYDSLNRFINMTVPAVCHRTHHYKPCVLAICGFLLEEPADLFPSEIPDQQLKPKEGAFEIGNDSVPLLSLGSGEEDLDRALDQSDLSRIFAKNIAMLNPKEQAVLAMWFGIGPEGEEITISEISSRMHFSRERVRHIARSGIKKLRQMRNLRDFMSAAVPEWNLRAPF